MTEITLKEAIADSRGWIDLKHLNSIKIEFRHDYLGSKDVVAEAIVINHGMCLGAGLPEDESIVIP